MEIYIRTMLVGIGEVPLGKFLSYLLALADHVLWKIHLLFTWPFIVSCHHRFLLFHNLLTVTAEPSKLLKALFALFIFTRLLLRGQTPICLPYLTMSTTSTKQHTPWQ